jgi:hypothetical protein
MTQTVNLYEAKTRLSELVELAFRGEEIVIAKSRQAKSQAGAISRGSDAARAR